MLNYRLVHYNLRIWEPCQIVVFQRLRSEIFPKLYARTTLFYIHCDAPDNFLERQLLCMYQKREQGRGILFPFISIHGYQIRKSQRLRSNDFKVN